MLGGFGSLLAQKSGLVTTTHVEDS
jgi:hypothetical protein